MDVVQSLPGWVTPYDYESITVSNSAIGFTAAKLNPQSSDKDRNFRHARYIFATVEDADIRWTVDGTTPVADTTGHLAEDGSVLEFANYQAMLNFRAIRETGADAHFRVTYCR